jgi:hypothetical protein
MKDSSQDASTFCRQPNCGRRGIRGIDSGGRLCYICPRHKDIIRYYDGKGIDQTNPSCACHEHRPSRRIRQQDRFYFQCAKLNCGFSSMYLRSYEICP